MKVNSVVTRVGGKYGLRDEIVKFFPHGHKIYCEPFLGAAHILFAKDRSPVEIVNDISAEVVTFFRVLRDNADELIEMINVTPYSREQFDELKKMVPTSDVQKAWRYYTINRLCFSGKLTDKATFGSGIKRPPAFYKKMKYFKPVIDRLSSVIIENLDYRDFFRRYCNDPSVFIFADPPYVGGERQYSGVFKFGEADHIKLAELLYMHKGKWLLTYNDVPFVRELYRDFPFITLERHENVNLTKDGKERMPATDVLIGNFGFQDIRELPLFRGVTINQEVTSMIEEVKTEETEVVAGETEVLEEAQVVPTAEEIDAKIVEVHDELMLMNAEDFGEKSVMEFMFDRYLDAKIVPFEGYDDRVEATKDELKKVASLPFEKPTLELICNLANLIYFDK